MENRKKQNSTSDAERVQKPNENDQKSVSKNGNADKKKGSHQTATICEVMTEDGTQDMSSKGALHSMILPVMVSHADRPDEEVLTSALLDSMSDSLFIKEELIKKLKASSVSTTLEVSTLVSKNVIPTELVISLTIRGMNENIMLQLPRTYGRSEIPMDRSLVPRPENVRRWPHLQEDQLQDYIDYLDVGLLIGANCSAAMMPKRVVASDDHEPYALKTPLGWGVIGWMQTVEIPVCTLCMEPPLEK